MSELIIIRIEEKSDQANFVTVEIREANVGDDKWTCSTAGALLRDKGVVNETSYGCALADSGGTVPVVRLKDLHLDPDPTPIPGAMPNGEAEFDALPEDSQFKGTDLRWRLIAVDP